MAKKKNRLRDILEEFNLKQSQIADKCGIKRDRFRKIVGNHVEIIGWELTKIAEVLRLEERVLYEPDQIDVKTFVETEHPEDALHPGKIGRWHAQLSAHDEDSIYWLRQGLKQLDWLIEGPGFAKVKLTEGRILFGRAVEYIGVSIEDEDRDSSRIMANQMLSVIREGAEDDKKLSRFQFDITFSGDKGFLLVYVQSHKIKVREQGRWRMVQAGESVYLQNNDLVQLPNRKFLKVEMRRI